MSGIIRVQKRPEYFVASKAAFENNGLSWEARGVMSYLLTKPPEWECRNTDLVRQGPAGGDKIERILDELKAHGYVRRVRFKTDEGKFDWLTEVYESPEINPDYDNLDEIARKVELKHLRSEQKRRRAYEKQKQKTIGVLYPYGDVNVHAIGGFSTPGESPYIVINESVNNESLKTTTTQPVGSVVDDDDKKRLLEEVETLYVTHFGPLRGPQNKEAADSLKGALKQYGISAVIEAIRIAVSPERRNGSPRTWGYVLGILEKAKRKPEVPSTSSQTISEKEGHPNEYSITEVGSIDDGARVAGEESKGFVTADFIRESLGLSSDEDVSDWLH